MSIATSANSPSWVRTYTKDDGTKYQIAYRTNTVWIQDADGKQYSINETLINEGHAYVYEGGTKKVFKG